MTRNWVALTGAPALVLLLAVPAARADAPANSNNCLGTAFSGLVPGETSTEPPSYGDTTQAQAQDGVRDDLLTDATGALAGCGTPAP